MEPERQRQQKHELGEELSALHAESFAWALSCCDRDPQDAEDVLHAVYVKVLSGQAKFEGRSSLKTWLFGVIRNTARARRRTFARRLRLLSGWADQRPEGAERQRASQEEALAAAQRREQIEHALGLLSGKQREVIELVFFHDMTIEQASEVMGAKLGTTRTHYARAKKRLLAHLQADPTFEWEPA